MKPRLLIPLLLCLLLLAGCYRQAEEPFQQVDSAEVVSPATATSAEIIEVSGDATPDQSGSGTDDEASETTGQQYITPETVPGQVEQPPVALTTRSAAQPATITAPIVFPSPTLSFEEQLDPNDGCVYQVQAGNVLFRLALAWDTTYQEIMDLNQLDSENLSIGQLLLIPGCESTAEESAAEAPAEENAALEPKTEVLPTSTPRPEFHVVSAGETLESISLRYRVDVNELIALNELTNPNQLNVGQELKLPQL